MKAIGWSLVFVLILIGLTMTATVLVLSGLWKPTLESTSKAACQLKIQKYCLMLVCDKQPDVDLTGCTESGAVPTKEECEKNYGPCKTG